MALRYTRLQSMLKVDVVGTVTLSGNTDIKVIDLTAAPFNQGFKTIMLVIQSASLNTTPLTVIAKVNTAANGSGTDYTIQTMALPVADSEMVLEIPCELVSSVTDANGVVAKSIVLDCSGNDTDTFEAAVISELLYEQESLTTTDVTTVT